MTQLVLAGFAAGFAACSDNPITGTNGPPPSGALVVSNPLSASVAGAALADLAAAPGRVGTVIGDSVVYVSVPAGSAPAGVTASVRNVARPGFITTFVIDGGVDPVPLGAKVGDSVDVVVRAANGQSVLHIGAVVAASRPPVVVRTWPPHKKVEVPLNSVMVIVFSEPVSVPTLNGASVRLFQGTTAVAGTVDFLDATHVTARFVPAAPLVARTDYSLVVSATIRDLENKPLAAPVTVDFTTGTTLLGAVASVTLLPDTFVIQVGSAMQLTVTARDAQGNVVPGHPVSWSTDNPPSAVVTTAGLVTGLAEGQAVITAIVDGVAARAVVVVRQTVTPVASVIVTPESARALVGGMTVPLVAEVFDAAGRPVPFPLLTWASSDPAVATVPAFVNESYGRFVVQATGVGAGRATIIATSEGHSDSVTVQVLAAPPVYVTPASAVLERDSTALLIASSLDSAGNRFPLFGAEVTWVSADTTIATVVRLQMPPGTVPAQATVTAHRQGTATIAATWQGQSGTATITVLPHPSVASVTLSPSTDTIVRDAVQRLAVTVKDSAGNVLTGRGVTWASGDSTIATVSDSGVLTGLAPGLVTISATSEGKSGSASIVVEVVSFVQISAGDAHTCGLTSAGRAYCWGDNYYGQLGNGERRTYSRAPVRVSGTLTFQSIAAGDGFTCALISGAAAYCWGRNDYSQLGGGTTDSNHAVPDAVQGALTFTSLAPGAVHACGVATNQAGYCWGKNEYGRLGNGSLTNSSTPTRVANAIVFQVVRSGTGHSCGLANSGQAYCWGYGYTGELGTGTTMTYSTLPVPVTGGFVFVSLGIGASHTCGIDANHAAFCWGYDNDGQLGNNNQGPQNCGGYGCSLAPDSVVGGLRFGSIEGGALHSCGLTTLGAAYCWGANAWGELGDGTSGNTSFVPVAVLGGHTFASLSVRGHHACAIDDQGVTYCWGEAMGAQGGNALVPVKAAGQP